MSQAGAVSGNSGPTPPTDLTLTGNSGVATAAADNINTPGNNTANNGFATWTSGSGDTLSIKSYGTVKWVVNSIAGVGTHQTIAAALASASSGDDIFLTPNTYNENITLVPGVNLCSYGADPFNPNVIFNGTMTINQAGNYSLTGLDLQTNGAPVISITGSNVLTLNLNDCALKPNSSDTMLSCINSSATINLFYCTGVNNDTSSYLTIDGGAVFIRACYFKTNTITGSASTINNANININNTLFNNSITTTGNSSCSFLDSDFFGSTLTINGLGNNTIQRCRLQSVTTIGLNASCTISNCDIFSNTNPVITGLGTIAYSGLNFLSGGKTIDTSLQICNTSSNDSLIVVRPSSYPYNIIPQDAVISVDTSSSANTVNLPASPMQGEKHTVKDLSANSATNNITVNGNGHNIVGTSSASTQTISLNGAAVTYVYDTSVWLAI